jgi:hypothetical protein
VKISFKTVKLRASGAALLQSLTAKKTAWLKAHGCDRVLVVYDDEQHASLYPEGEAALRPSHPKVVS